MTRESTKDNCGGRARFAHDGGEPALEDFHNRPERRNGEKMCLVRSVTARGSAKPAIRLSPRAVRRALLAIVGALTVASVIAQVLHYGLEAPYAHGLVPLFDSDAEGNLPTWYSSLALLACSLLAGLVARSTSGWDRRWLILAGLFFLAAVDESVRLHENANDLVSTDLEAGGVLSALWVVPGLVLVAAVAVAYRPVVAGLPQRVRSLAVRGALLFAVGALGFEVVEGAVSDLVGEADSLADGLASVGQELLEMLGVVMFIEALMTYLAITRSSVEIDFGGGDE